MPCVEEKKSHDRLCRKTSLKAIKKKDSSSELSRIKKSEQCTSKKQKKSTILSENSYISLPKKSIVSEFDPNPIAKISGPDGKEKAVSFKNKMSGICSSTYPTLDGLRAGDPICDRFESILFDKRCIMAIADGCSWGKRSQQAAEKALSAFMRYMLGHHQGIRDVQDAGHFLLRAFDQASREITKDLDQIWDAGTTTLLGGMLLQLKEEENTEDSKRSEKWCFICVNVGDCKAIRWSCKQRKLFDITKGSRINASDPGGRLGPTLEGGQSDLRNMKIYYTECNPGDSIVFMSDGIHDNFDPRLLGKTPQDLSLQSNSWEECSRLFPNETSITQTKFMERSFARIFKHYDTIHPKKIVKKLFSHCWNLTKESRLFMQENVNKRLPQDFEKYPGKMDHSTCLCVQVGSIIVE